MSSHTRDVQNCVCGSPSTAVAATCSARAASVAVQGAAQTPGRPTLAFITLAPEVERSDACASSDSLAGRWLPGGGTVVSDWTQASAIVQVSLMKVRHPIRIVVLGVFLVVCSRDAGAQQDPPPPPQDDVYDDTDPTALVDFHATLDPNGSWVDDPTYGTIWVPNADAVGPDFVPYASGGHWAYGDNGDDYTWISDYDWGWAPFHYGRWIYADGRGWSWIPGREYAPAWVDWRTGDPGVAFVGWAPAPPTFIWRGGVAVDIGVPVPARFVYCGSGDIFHPHLFERIVRGPRVDGIAIHMRPFEEHPWGGGRRFFGPPPARLGIEPGRIVHFTGNERGIVHAREFCHPSLAVRYGAHPPMRERPGERPGEHPFERAGERPGERPFDRPGERPGERVVGHGLDRPGDRPMERPHADPAAHGPGEVRRQGGEFHGAAQAHGSPPGHAAPRHK